MAPVVGQLPSATFSRDLVTLNRGCEEVPADSARCPLANEGPLERALTLVSRQEPPPSRGHRQEREEKVMPLPAPTWRAGQATWEMPGVSR